ncbi:MAG TPA: tail fiber domain-containing protein, partial [Leptospiraceae bacterium]|nr:tail fiber domain-containing protein [Leptospiraceae bacterium]
IRPMESVLDKVSQLVPKTYHWRSEEYPNKKFGTQKEYGLVAQDVEKIFPDMVENDSNGMKAIHYERLPILTVQAVKELSLRLRGATEDLDREKLENAKLKQKLLSVEERLNVLERMVKK